MQIRQITLSNFQAFGPAPVTIELEDLTSLVGANGSGKTSVLVALCRMFGTTPALRQLVPEDFHVPCGQRREDEEERKLRIEVLLDFPELQNEGEEDPLIPAMYNQMAFRTPGTRPCCRMRLEATWTKTLLHEGEIQEQMHWIRSAEGEDEVVTPVQPRDRSRIQVFYVPASRDTTKQLANVSGTLLHQLLSSIHWSDELKGQIRNAADGLRQVFDQIRAIEHINEATRQSWAELYDEQIHKTPTLQFVASELGDVIRDTQVVFNPGNGTDNHQLEMLSDGQKSLFYFAFINTLFGVRRQVFEAHHLVVEGREEEQSRAAEITEHISYDRLRPAAFTLFAVEEPENHLGPHYLGRIIKQLKQIGDNRNAQVVLTSHSSSILSRVEPEEIRYFRIDPEHQFASVRKISLPASGTEAYKYIREAVRAYPELYFARLVVLCEGDSEEMLIPKFARASGGELDLSLISVVPLGGRHVNHFWRLLNELQIPHITLLDLDSERETGGWARIEYVTLELLKVLPDEQQQSLRSVNEGGAPLSNEEIRNLSLRDVTDVAVLREWITHLREFDVFFSEPLDLDFMMLSSFPEAYKSTVVRGPVAMRGDISEEQIAQGRRRVLGENADGHTYSREAQFLFPWYATLFYGRGKPTTHTAAWVAITPENWADNRPEPISALLSAIERKLISNREVN